MRGMQPVMDETHSKARENTARAFDIQERRRCRGKRIGSLLAEPDGMIQPPSARE